MKPYIPYTILLMASLAWSQSQPAAVILDMRIENRVVYVEDTADVTKFATAHVRQCHSNGHFAKPKSRGILQFAP
jgi:hypothetical protein